MLEARAALEEREEPSAGEAGWRRLRLDGRGRRRRLPVPGPRFAQARQTLRRVPAAAEGDHGERLVDSLCGLPFPRSFVDDHERIVPVGTASTLTETTQAS